MCLFVLKRGWGRSIYICVGFVCTKELGGELGEKGQMGGRQALLSVPFFLSLCLFEPRITNCSPVRM